MFIIYELAECLDGNNILLKDEIAEFEAMSYDYINDVAEISLKGDYDDLILRISYDNYMKLKKEFANSIARHRNIIRLCGTVFNPEEDDDIWNKLYDYLDHIAYHISLDKEDF